eukprot:GHRQ01021164.1.p6 GENE.GHRQ01021164.1~~GHRQ01021164.1.p6  ORF type:complete len:106 (-),score=44.55 GHRQ01021164.1:35-352(-)
MLHVCAYWSSMTVQWFVTVVALLALQVGIVSGRFDAADPASPLQLLLRDVGPMLKAAARQLADKSPKTRVGMFAVLRTLVGVLPGSVADHVGMLVPGACCVHTGT